MNKVKVSSMMFLLIVIVSLCKADGYVTKNVITRLEFNTGGLYIYADKWFNANVADRTSAVVLLSSDPNYDKALALILTAFVNEYEIDAYSDDICTFDSKTYNVIRGWKYLRVYR